MPGLKTLHITTGVAQLADHVPHGLARSCRTSDSLLLMLGLLPTAGQRGGRYGPQPVTRSSEWVSATAAHLLPAICFNQNFNKTTPLLTMLTRLVSLLSAEMPDFIGPQYWPPNSPDLSPVDFVIWGILQTRVTVRGVDLLREWLVHYWCHFYQRIVDRTVSHSTTVST